MGLISEKLHSRFLQSTFADSRPPGHLHFLRQRFPRFSLCLHALLLNLLGRNPTSCPPQPQAAGPKMEPLEDLNPSALSSSLQCSQPRPQNTDAPTRTHTRAEWNSHKENIRLLYCVKGKKLQEVVELFKRQHDFWAT